MAQFVRQITVTELYREDLWKRQVVHYQLEYMVPHNPYRSDEDLLQLVYREIEHHFPPRDLGFDVAKIHDYHQNGEFLRDNENNVIVRFNVNYHIPGS